MDTLRTIPTRGVDIINGQPWMADASCNGVADELRDHYFFPDNGFNHPPAARQMCRACPVKSECLSYGLEEPAGLWGGLSGPERQRLRAGAVA